MSRTPPIGSDVTQCKPDELRRSLVGREVAPCFDDLAQLRVDVLDGVRNRHDIGGASRSRAGQFGRMV